jgi:murein DD-endopeptidase MepM/ murein hydrolase activator NlpD
MRTNRLYTFILANHANAKPLRISVSYPLLCAIGIFSFIGVIAAGTAVYHYGRMLVKVSSYNSILAENDTFRSENHNYRIQTAQLGERIDFLETLSRKLTTLSGMNARDRVGGEGGFSKEGYNNKPRPASAGTLKSIDKYNKSVSMLEDQYRGLEENLFDDLLNSVAWPRSLPLKGYITAGVGRRRDPFDSSVIDNHSGLDISAPYGSPVYAPADGIVIFAGQREGYGKLVVVDHRYSGAITRYGHLSKINVEVGQRIYLSDVLGYVGTTGRTTGPHLHYEIWYHGYRQNPLKPTYLTMLKK